jgi:heptosyltransferase-2
MKTVPVSAIDRRHAKPILVYPAGRISDTILAFPFLQRLRELEPSAHISVLSPAPLAELWQRNPSLNDVIAFTTKPDLRGLRQREFAVALLLCPSLQAAWVCQRAGIPRRIGFAGNRRRWLLTDVVHESRSEHPTPRAMQVDGVKFRMHHVAALRHQAHRYLDLISYLGGNRDLAIPHLRLEAGELPALTKFLREGTRSFIGIHPGGAPAKRWPAERFGEAARRIADEVPARFIIFGQATEAALATEVEH